MDREDRIARNLAIAEKYYDGYHVGVPYGPDAYSFMYNSALFKQAGLSIPTTQAQLLSDLAALKTKLPSGVSPFVFSAGASEQLPALFFESYSGYFINKAGHYALDPAAAVSAPKPECDGRVDDFAGSPSNRKTRCFN